MAHTKSALKRLRQNEKRQQRNRFWKGTMRTSIKKFRKLVEEGNLENAKAALPGLMKLIDKVATKGVIKKEQASRRVSRMAKMVLGKKAEA